MLIVHWTTWGRVFESLKECIKSGIVGLVVIKKKVVYVKIKTNEIKKFIECKVIRRRGEGRSNRCRNGMVTILKLDEINTVNFTP